MVGGFEDSGETSEDSSDDDSDGSGEEYSSENEGSDDDGSEHSYSEGTGGPGSDSESGFSGNSSGSEGGSGSQPRKRRRAGAAAGDAALAAELAAAKAEEGERAMKLMSSAASDAQVGEAVRAQNSIWQSFLRTRIILQGALAAANAPGGILEAETQREASAEAAAACWGVVTSALAIHGACEETAKDSVKDGGVPDLARVLRKGTKRDADKAFGTAWELLDGAWEAYRPTRDGMLDRWNKRVMVRSAKMAATAFKAIDQSFTSQVSSVLADSDRLTKRTRVRRTRHPLNSETVNDDEEIFDDTDLYTTLLRDLIESSAGPEDATNPLAMTRRAIAIRQMAKEGTRSKHPKGTKPINSGRVLKYNVHDKLVGFCPKEENEPENVETIRDALFSRLFGQHTKLEAIA